jgi:hypothetical protein
MMVEMARFEQRLARNAADAQAGAAEHLFLFDAGDVQAELGRANGGDVTAGTCADDDEIVVHAVNSK